MTFEVKDGDEWVNIGHMNEEGITVDKPSDITADINKALPDHTVLAAPLSISDKPVPITAMVNGKKVKVGEGRLDPETGLFHGEFEEGNANAEILRGQIMGSGGNYSTSIHVSEAKVLTPDEVTVLIPNIIKDMRLHSVSLVKEANPQYGSHPIDYHNIGVSQDVIDRDLAKDPIPKFHNHD